METAVRTTRYLMSFEEGVSSALYVVVKLKSICSIENRQLRLKKRINGTQYRRAFSDRTSFLEYEYQVRRFYKWL